MVAFLNDGIDPEEYLYCEACRFLIRQEHEFDNAEKLRQLVHFIRIYVF